MKRAIYSVLTIHTLIILFVLWSDLRPAKENYAWAFAMIVDFPVSVPLAIFASWVYEHFLVGRGLSDSYQVLAFIKLIEHVVVGGLWWTAIVLGIKRIAATIRSRSVTR